MCLSDLITFQAPHFKYSLIHFPIKEVVNEFALFMLLKWIVFSLHQNVMVVSCIYPTSE